MPIEPAGGEGIDYSSIMGMDPGANWLLGPGREYFYPPGVSDALIPVLLWLKDEAAVQAARPFQLESLDEKTRMPGFILAGAEPLDRSLKPDVYYSVLATQALFDSLVINREERFNSFRRASKRIQLCLPLAPSAVSLRSGSLPAPPPHHWPEGTVVMGIIDDGIAFANNRFRRADGTSRVEAFWIQESIPGDKPSNYGFGRHLDRVGINSLIAQCTHSALGNEEELYRRCGLADFTSPLHKAAAWRIAHGTHVLDLAAGWDPALYQDDRPIIGVQLPVASTANQSGAGLEFYVQVAIDYIIDHAASLRPPHHPRLPVVINFSYGTHAGPHDGTSMLEAFIDRLPDHVHVVLPAGNSLQSRCHSHYVFQQSGDSVASCVRVQPDGLTVNTIEFWLPFAAGQPTSSRVSLHVEAPDGRQGTLLEAPNQSFALGIPGKEYCYATYDYVVWPTERGVFRVDIGPTAQIAAPGAIPDSSALAPSGAWTFRLENASLTSNDPVEAWIERNDRLYGYPRRGRQAYFDDPRYQRFDARGVPVVDDDPQTTCVERRDGIVNAIGTGLSPLVPGGFVRKTWEATRYSAGGPISPLRGTQPNPGEPKPDALVVSDDSLVHSGVLGAGTRSGSTVALSGTSLACPQVARWCAEQLAQNLPADRAAFQALAVASENAHPPPKPPLPPARGGAGRVDLRTQPPPAWRTRYWMPAVPIVTPRTATQAQAVAVQPSWLRRLESLWDRLLRRRPVTRR